MPADTRHRRRGSLAVLVAGGLLAGLTAGEVILRSLPERPDKRQQFVADPVLHHRLRPEFRGTVAGQPFSVNALGFRDREIAVPKPAGVWRVVMLGDSFTEGAGLPPEATVARGVEARLSAGPCGAGVEVVNAGVSSYSPILEYLLFTRTVAALAPDLVVLNFDMTDVHDDYVRTQIARLDAAGLPLAVPHDRRREATLVMAPMAPPWLAPLERPLIPFALYQGLRLSGPVVTLAGRRNLTPEQLEQKGLIGDLRYDRLAITRDLDSPHLRAGWALTRRYLLASHDAVRAAGAEFVVVVYPHSHQVSAGESLAGRRRMGIGDGLFASVRPFRIVAGIGYEAGFPVIDLLALFRAREATDAPLFRSDDIHYTAAGAAVFADGVAAGLEGRVPCRRPRRQVSRRSGRE